MRKILLFALLLAATGMSAQNILPYSSWWDGRVLYTVTAQKTDRLQFDGEDQFGSSFGNHFFLVPTGKEDEYTLIGQTIEDVPLDPRCEATAKVNHVTIGNDEYLVVRRLQTGDAVYTLKRTDKDIDGALMQQIMLEGFLFESVYADEVLNTEYLRHKPMEQLRLMRNEILARHGYRFQSKDLQEYFGKQYWYKPGNDNNAIRLNTVEQLNVEMIKSEEGTLDVYRQEGDADQSYYVSPNDRGEYIVRNAEEFIANLGSNRKIIIPAGVTLNLQKTLADEYTYAEIASFLRAVKAGGERGTVFRECYDDGSCELELKNMSGLTIREGNKEPVYISGTTTRISQDGRQLSIRRDSDEPVCYSHFKGMIDGRIPIDIVWEQKGGNLIAGKILYPNAMTPAPILLVGHLSFVPTGEDISLTEYSSEGSVMGQILLSINNVESYDLQIGHWIDPKTFESKELICDDYGIEFGSENILPDWYGESMLTPEDPAHIGTYYSYTEWNPRGNDMTGGHISFRGEGAGQVSFECVNAPHNIAEGRSQPGRPAELHDNQFDYTDINECGYAIRATFYKRFVSIETTSGPFSTRCFGVGTSFAGIYIKTKD